MSKNSPTSSKNSSSNSLYKDRKWTTIKINPQEINNSSESTLDSISNSISLTNDLSIQMPTKSKVSFHKELRTIRNPAQPRNKRSLVIAEIDGNPFDFSVNKDPRSELMIDDEFYPMADIFEFQQLPTMNDCLEGVIDVLK